MDCGELFFSHQFYLSTISLKVTFIYFWLIGFLNILLCTTRDQVQDQTKGMATSDKTKYWRIFLETFPHICVCIRSRPKFQCPRSGRIHIILPTRPDWHNKIRWLPVLSFENLKNALKDLLQCCGSGMFIPDPDFYPSRIPDLGSRIPKTWTKERGEKIFLLSCLVATNFTKFKIILFFKCWRKKFGPIFKEL